MNKTGALILFAVGLVLAVGVPVAVAIGFNIDPGQKPGLLVGGMMPGVCVIALARRLWKGEGPPRPAPGQVPPGHIVCDLCGKAVPAAAGATRGLDHHLPMAWAAFVCHACTRYRTLRALTILLLFLAALGVFALIVQMTIAKK
jgi:hypothetical protein